LAKHGLLIAEKWELYLKSLVQIIVKWLD